MKRVVWTLVAFLLVITSGFVLVKFYSYIFAREVKGVIVKVEKPTAPVAVVGSTTEEGSRLADRQLFSYAVAIREEGGEIVTASTEDRQWSVAEEGKCVEAKFFPYPPWDLNKSGTYHKARLIKLYDCQK